MSIIFVAATACAGGNVKELDTPENSTGTVKEASTGFKTRSQDNPNTVFMISNGIEVIHKEISENPIATIEIFLKGGIINETPQKAGISYLTQTLLLQGTKSRSSEALAAEIENIGASISSDIEYDYASLGISSLDTNVEKSAELLSDIVSNPVFDEGEVAKEKENILASLQSRKDQISTVAGDVFNSAFYGSHPYSWPEPGKASTVAKLKREDLVKWHRGFYVSNNMILVIAGRIKLDAARALAEKYFVGIPTGTALTSAAKPNPPAAKKVIERSTKFQQAFIMDGFAAPSVAQDDFYALKVLNGVLGGRMTGRLFVELREKLSLAYEVSSYYPSRKELSRFVVYMGLDKKNITLAQKRINELLTEVRETPVSEAELTDTKNYLKGTYLLDRQTVGRKAWYLGWWETLGLGPDYDETYLNRLMSVTSADVQKAAQKYLTANTVTVEIIPGIPSAPRRKK